MPLFDTLKNSVWVKDCSTRNCQWGDSKGEERRRRERKGRDKPACTPPWAIGQGSSVIPWKSTGGFLHLSVQSRVTGASLHSLAISTCYRWPLDGFNFLVLSVGFRLDLGDFLGFVEGPEAEHKNITCCAWGVTLPEGVMSGFHIALSPAIVPELKSATGCEVPKASSHTYIGVPAFWSHKGQ